MFIKLSDYTEFLKIIFDMLDVRKKIIRGKRVESETYLRKMNSELKTMNFLQQQRWW